jgi:hypothetical protein
MKKIKKLVLPVLLVVVCLPVFQRATAQVKQYQLALIEDHVEKKELSAIYNLLKTQKGFSFQQVSLEKLKQQKAAGFTHIWYHRTDTGEIKGEETALKETIRNFVQ